MNFIDAEHYSKVEPGVWRWPDFSPDEMACRGTGRLHISVLLMDNLQRLRDTVGPLIINSAYRSPEHNKAVGGAPNSQHVQGLAADVSMSNHDPAYFEQIAKLKGFTGFGFYPPGKGNFIHLDLARPRTWGKRWKAAKFDAEPKPTTGKKAGALLGVSGFVGGAAQVVSPDALMEVQKTVQPWVAMAPVFGGVFAACGFGLVGWMLFNRYVRKAP